MSRNLRSEDVAHVLNRAYARMMPFEAPADYELLKQLAKARRRMPVTKQEQEAGAK